MLVKKVGFIDRLIFRRRFRMFKKRFRPDGGNRVSLKRLRSLNIQFSEQYGFECSYIHEVLDNQFVLASFCPFLCEWFVFSIDGEFPHLMTIEEIPKIEWYVTRNA